MPSEPAKPPPAIPDHELLRCVGRGSYGEVWLARNVMGTFRAVKVIYRSTFLEDRPFDREFQGIQKFEPVSRTHPGLVAVLHVGRNVADGYFYYVMEVADDETTGQQIDPATYIPKTLGRELVRRGHLPPAECVSIALALTSALGHMHWHSLIHRDIKPSNIIFVQGQPKFADIGLVTEISERATYVGTIGYMPPEGPGSPSADLFSLGKVFYEMTMGKECSRFPELPTGLNETQSFPTVIRLNQIILKACEPNPSQRFQSAQELYDALMAEAALGQSSPQGAGPAPGEPAPVVSPPSKAKPPASGPLPAPPKVPQVTILHRAQVQPDVHLLEHLSVELSRRGYQVISEHQGAPGIEWVRRIETTLSEADAVIILLSAQSAQSEMIAYEVETAFQIAQQQHGRPRLLPVRICFSGDLPSSLARSLVPPQCFYWDGEPDNDRLVVELVRALEAPSQAGDVPAPLRLESVGGAVPLDSEFYVVRPADREFQTAIARRDSIVLVKGARQMGKTSLLARGVKEARDSGATVVLTDFQKLNAAHLASVDSFYRTMGDFLADQLDLTVLPEEAWDKRRSPNTNFERYLRREVLNKISVHLVWGLDEVDRLFTCDFGSEVFGLFRSWHNERALDPAGPWSRLTLAIAYATEAHLFITDVNQSPFNVGTRLTLHDFTIEQVADLNRRLGSPLRNEAELKRFHTMLGGQPYLVRRGLNELAAGGGAFDAFVAQADRDEGIFGDHLRRILVLLAKESLLREVLRGILRGQTCLDTSSFYRLRSAGLVRGDSPQQVQPRCGIYASYLKTHLE